MKTNFRILNHKVRPIHLLYILYLTVVVVAYFIGSIRLWSSGAFSWITYNKLGWFH